MASCATRGRRPSIEGHFFGLLSAAAQIFFVRFTREAQCELDSGALSAILGSMRVVDFFNLQAGLLFSFLVSASVGVLSLNRPQYRAARVLGILSALLFGSLAVVWGVTTPVSFWPRVLAVGIAGFFAAALLSEGIRFVYGQEKQDAPVAAQAPTTPQRGATLEATNGSKIDASGAVIPGDLPFQLGKADGGSLIDMPGLVATKTENGWSITPAANSEKSFPAPPDNLAKMSSTELKQAMQALIGELRTLQRQFDDEFFEPGHKYPGHEKADAVLQKYAATYKTEFSQKAFDLASAALSRIGRLSNLSRDANYGGSVVYHKMFVGPRPADGAATFLETLEGHLPAG